jgi:hypothetical protein
MGKWDVEVLVVLVRVKGKGFKACSGVLHGGGVVATDGRSGYRGVCTGRHRGGASAVGRPSGGAWHAQELEVVLGKPCRRWAAATEAEQRGKRRGQR